MRPGTDEGSPPSPTAFALRRRALAAGTLGRACCLGRRSFSEGGRRGGAAALLVGGLLVAGCSSSSTVESSDSPTFSSRMSSFFSSAPKDGVTRTATGEPAAAEIECPGVDVRQGASTLSVTAAKSNQPTAGDLRYQVSFGQIARECIVQPGTMTIKVGVQGRIIVGPAGGPGQVDIPLRYAVVREGPEPRTIVTRFKRAQAMVGPNDANLPFTDIDDGLTFPMPSLAELETYVVYVGFDPIGEKPEKKPPPKTAKRSPR